MGQLAGEDTTRTKTHIVQDMQGKRCLTNAIQATRKLSKQREIVMGLNTCTVRTQCLGPRPHFDKLSLWGIMNPGLPFHVQNISNAKQCASALSSFSSMCSLCVNCVNASSHWVEPSQLPSSQTRTSRAMLLEAKSSNAQGRKGIPGKKGLLQATVEKHSHTLLDWPWAGTTSTSSKCPWDSIAAGHDHRDHGLRGRAKPYPPGMASMWKLISCFCKIHRRISKGRISVLAKMIQ